MERETSAAAMPVTRRGTWHVLLCLLAAWPILAHGHATRLSSSTLTVTGTQVTGIVEVNGPDLEVALGVALRGLSGSAGPCAS